MLFNHAIINSIEIVCETTLYPFVCQSSGRTERHSGTCKMFMYNENDENATKTAKRKIKIEVKTNLIYFQITPNHLCALPQVGLRMRVVCGKEDQPQSKRWSVKIGFIVDGDECEGAARAKAVECTTGEWRMANISRFDVKPLTQRARSP